MTSKWKVDRAKKLLVRLAAFATAIAMVVLGAGVALADDVENSVGTNAGSRTVTRGGSALSVNYWIDKTKDDGYGNVEAGSGVCNATPTTPASVTITVPTGISVSNSALSFTACGTETTNFQTVTFTPVASAPLGDNSISHAVTGFANKADFQLRVLPRGPGGATAAVTGSTQVDLTWTRSADHAEITQYQIERASSATGTYTELASVNPASSAGATQVYSHTGLSAETQYCYRVRARYAAGSSHFDSAFTTPTCATTAAESGGTPGDTAAPTGASITIDDGAHWTKSSAGTVSLDFSASDNVGVASFRLAETSAGLATATSTGVSPAEASFGRTDQSFSLSGSEGSKSVWLQVCDAANNCSTASDSIGWDKTAPTVDCDPVTFLLNEPDAFVSATVTDPGGSGVAAEGSPVSGSATTTAMGSFTGTSGVEVTGSDIAGNEATKECGYSVSARSSNFSAPVDPANKAKAGQAIPLKFTLTDYYNQPVTSLVFVTPMTKGCASTAGNFDTIETYVTAGSSGLQNLGNGNYQFNWKTASTFAGLCKELTLAWNGGQHSQNPIFNFTK